MTEGLGLALGRAFGALRLHRVVANIQPGNERSIRLVQRLDFTREGFSRRYLRIAGRWRDHERWAILAEDWRRLPRRRERHPARRPSSRPRR
jgi:[ribosomal protein S5]-alanine N-acetyltransferase